MYVSILMWCRLILVIALCACVIITLMFSSLVFRTPISSFNVLSSSRHQCVWSRSLCTLDVNGETCHICYRRCQLSTDTPTHLHTSFKWLPWRRGDSRCSIKRVIVFEVLCISGIEKISLMLRSFVSFEHVNIYDSQYSWQSHDQYTNLPTINDKTPISSLVPPPVVNFFISICRWKCVENWTRQVYSKP